MVLWLGVASPPAWFRNPSGWTKAIAVTVRKQQLAGFSQLLGHTVVGPTKSKMEFCHLWYPGSHSGCVPAVSGIFQTDLCSLDLCYRENVMEGTFGCWFAFPCEIGGLPTVTPSDEIATEK